MHGLDEMHRLDCHRCNTSLRMLSGMDSSRDIHLREDPVAENIATRIRVRRHGERPCREIPSWLHRHRGGSAQIMFWPPSADIVEPVMKPASSDARNATVRAISYGSPSRPTGI